jgi:hypothetical protein
VSQKAVPAPALPRLNRFCGFLFVKLDSAAAPIAALLPGVETAVKTLCPDIEARVFALEHNALERCNWLMSIENYNECYHCKVAHHTFFSGVVDPQSYAIQVFSDAARCLRHTAKAQRTLLGKRVLVEPWLRDWDEPLNLDKCGYFGSERDGGFADFTTVDACNVHAMESMLSDAELATFATS